VAPSFRHVVDRELRLQGPEDDLAHFHGGHGKAAEVVEDQAAHEALDELLVVWRAANLKHINSYASPIGSQGGNKTLFSIL
jgi:hypothetical protein